jgi:hypothetical protein
MVINIMPTRENMDEQLATATWREGQRQQSMFFYGYKSQAAHRGGEVGPRLATAGR